MQKMQQVSAKEKALPIPVQHLVDMGLVQNQAAGTAPELINVPIGTLVGILQPSKHSSAWAVGLLSQLAYGLQIALQRFLMLIM